MDKKQAVLKTLEADATEAAWRLAGSQLVKLCREPVVAFLSRHVGKDDDPGVRARVAAFLDTEVGEALLAAMLSLGLTMLPNLKQTGNIPQQLARELRVRSMAGMGDVIADVLMGPLRQVIVNFLQGAPTEETTPAALPAQSEGVVHLNPSALTEENVTENVSVEKRFGVASNDR